MKYTIFLNYNLWPLNIYNIYIRPSLLLTLYKKFIGV